MINFDIEKKLEKKLEKLYKKDNQTYERIIKKIKEITNSNSTEHYKNLKHDLKNFKRVQIGENVLIFTLDKTRNKIQFYDFDHHDKIYLKKF